MRIALGHMTLAWLIGSIVLLAGCSSSRSAEDDPPIAPVMTEALKGALENAKPCLESGQYQKAEHEFSEKFKYGCFCGKGHPFASGPLGNNVQPAIRDAYIEAYFTIQPFDDIDAACRAHDICWTMHGRPELACSQALSEEMKRLTRAFNDAVPFFKTTPNDTRNIQCAWLSLDIGTATLLIMEGVTDDPAVIAGRRFGKLFVSPITLTLATASFIASGINSYPPDGAPCKVDRI